MGVVSKELKQVGSAVAFRVSLSMPFSIVACN